MGYLDQTAITVDAILTKRGRELLAANTGAFKITQFALGDDEIDYSLFNENHPNGTQFAGEAIENMAIIEAFPDGNNIMKHKLITLDKGTSKLPVLTINTGIIAEKFDEKQPDESTFDDVSERIERLLSWIKDPDQFFKDFIAEAKDEKYLWRSVVEEYKKEI